MRAKFIYEKFEENSDSIHDLEIGGIPVNFIDVRKQIFKGKHSLEKKIRRFV
jgi:hypothetical protein